MVPFASHVTREIIGELVYGNTFLERTTLAGRVQPPFYSTDLRHSKRIQPGSTVDINTRANTYARVLVLRCPGKHQQVHKPNYDYHLSVRRGGLYGLWYVDRWYVISTDSSQNKRKLKGCPKYRKDKGTTAYEFFKRLLPLRSLADLTMLVSWET